MRALNTPPHLSGDEVGPVGNHSLELRDVHQPHPAIAFSFFHTFRSRMVELHTMRLSVLII